VHLISWRAMERDELWLSIAEASTTFLWWCSTCLGLRRSRNMSNHNENANL
jgi:hypothetical protein